MNSTIDQNLYGIMDVIVKKSVHEAGLKIENRLLDEQVQELVSNFYDELETYIYESKQDNVEWENSFNEPKDIWGE